MAAGRAVLRLYYLDGLTLDAIGALYRVHGSTITRWISRARARIVGEVERRLHERLRLEKSELEGLIGLIQSQLEVSVRRCLDE